MQRYNQAKPSLTLLQFQHPINYVLQQLYTVNAVCRYDKSFLKTTMTGTFR